MKTVAAIAPVLALAAAAASPARLLAQEDEKKAEAKAQTGLVVLPVIFSMPASSASVELMRDDTFDPDTPMEDSFFLTSFSVTSGWNLTNMLLCLSFILFGILNSPFENRS